MHNLAILCAEETAVFELGCAIELFALKRPEYKHWYKTDVITFGNDNIQTTTGITVKVKKVTSLKKYQTLLIPSWPVREMGIPTTLSKQILRLVERGGRVIAFCSGAFLLAELGLLEDRKAITHWRYEEIFKKRFANLCYQDNVLYTYDGIIGCSAGSAAALDLGIEVIRDDFGYQIANEVSRRLVLPAHRQGGQAQYVQTPVNKTNNHLSSVLDWAIKNLDKEIDINMLARRVNLSRRSFDRHFRATLGMSPKEWLNHQRLDLAKSLLEKKKMPIEIIAAHSGFQNAMNLRHYFRKYLGISPTQYRNQFLQG